MVRNKLFHIQQEIWIEGITRKPKLRFYASFKNKLSVANYVLYNLSPSERSIMAQIRLGILPLEVETGHFHNVKLEDRICNICNEGVEDESHFMFECTLY